MTDLHIIKKGNIVTFNRTYLHMIAILSVLVVALAACSSGEETSAEAGEDLVLGDETVADAALIDAAREEGSLVVYSGNSEEVELAVQEEFTADTGIEVENVRLPSGRLLERVLTEAGAGQLAADVIRISDQSFIEQIKEAGVLEEHEVPSDDVIDDQYKDPDGQWYASIISLMGITSHTDLVDEADAPTSYEDLLDEQWKGSIGFTHVGAGGSAWSVALMTRQKFGVEYWEALAAQDPSIYTSAATAAEEQARGEYQVGINHLGTVSTAIEQGAPLRFDFPEDGVASYPYYLSIVAESDNPNAARVFVNWSMSQRGGSVTAETAGEYSPHPDAALPTLGGEPLPALDELNLHEYEADDWISLREPWSKEWNELYGYTP